MFLLTHCQILKLKHLHRFVHCYPQTIPCIPSSALDKKKHFKNDFVVASQIYDALYHSGKMWKKKARLKFEENHPRFHTLVTSEGLLTMFLCTFLGVPRGVLPVRFKNSVSISRFTTHATCHAHFIIQRFHYFRWKTVHSDFLSCYAATIFQYLSVTAVSCTQSQKDPLTELQTAVPCTP